MSNTGVRQSIWIILGMALGALAGSYLGSSAAPLGEIGKLYIQLIKAIATPLLFFAIVEAILTTDIKFKSAIPYFVVVIINAICATTIGLFLANYFTPGTHLNFKTSLSQSALLAQVEGKSISLMSFIQGIIPNTIIEPFTENNILSIVILSIILGCAIRACRTDAASWIQTIEQGIKGGYQISEKLILWLVKLTPFAVFGVIAKTVGEHGFEPVIGLLNYLGTALLGLSLQVLIVYMAWIVIVAKIPLKKFWKAASAPSLYSFGVNSSLATLPLTLKSLDSLGISKASSRLGACIGTNLNNDGILLYEAMAVIFVTQAMGMNIDLAGQISIAALCVIASMGIAGVPEAGVIALAVILSTLGIPTEILPLLLTVDWIVARFRSVTNVIADMTSSIVIDRFSKNQEAV